jgi:hypothetical protein
MSGCTGFFRCAGTDAEVVGQDASNALELMECDAAVAAYPMRMAEWNALPAEGRAQYWHLYNPQQLLQ